MRRKAFGIDPVVDLTDPTGCDAHTLGEIALQILRHDNVAIYQRRMKAAQNCGPPSCAVEIVHVPAMFAVYAMPHACELGGRQRIQTRQVARMYDSRLQTPAQLKQLVAQFPHAYFRPVQRNDLSVGTCDALAEVSIILDTSSGMSQASLRHAVDQIDQTV